jgi:hypothetical protein
MNIMNPVHCLVSYLFETHLYIIFPHTFISPNCVSFDFWIYNPSKIFVYCCCQFLLHVASCYILMLLSFLRISNFVLESARRWEERIKIGLGRIMLEGVVCVCLCQDWES